METNFNIYCRLSNGDIVSKNTVDRAIELIARLKDGFTVVEITDEELFAKGNIIDAVKRFRDKHGVTLSEAKEAIDFMHGKKEV